MQNESSIASVTVTDAAELFLESASLNSLAYMNSGQVQIEVGLLNLIYVGAISIIEGLLANLFSAYLKSTEDNKLKLFNLDEYKKK